MNRRTGWRSLVEWTVAFGLLAFAVPTSIGIFVLPVAVGALVFASRRNRAWPDAVFGGLFGVGGFCLLVAYVNRAYSPCPLSRIEVVRAGERFACGGFNPMPWLMIGGLLVASGILGYSLFRSRQHLN